MLTFLSFLLSFFGTLNWFFIAVFQYDIIAGFFGFQASIMSRLCYFLIGIAGFALLILALKNRGTLKIFENPFKNKKNTKKLREKTANLQNSAQDSSDYEYEYTEAARENYNYLPEPLEPKFEKRAQDGYKDFDVTKYD